MAGRLGLGMISSHWQVEIPLSSTSNCIPPTPSWRSSYVRIDSLSNHSSTRGKQVHDLVSRTNSLGWDCAFVACRLRRSKPRKMLNSRRRALRIISEAIDDDQEDNKVGAFLNSLSPAGTAADMSENSGTAKPVWNWNPLKMLDRIADHADAQTEIGMMKRRAFYTAEDWTEHRSSKRHLRHILSTFKSRVIISLIPPVTALTCIAAVIATYNTLVDVDFLPSFFPLLHTSSLPYQLTAPALALLLVFRTEASYSRFDEGRKTWTKVFACSKDFSRQCQAWSQHPDDLHRRMDLQHYIMAFPVALKCYLLHEPDLYDDLKLLLDEDDLAIVMNSRHRPNCLIQLMTQTLVHLQISDNHRGLMDANITQFNESVSVCERLIRSPIPLSYTRLTSRTLILWHLTLPFVLWDECKWMLVFATFFSASTLFSIEEVGVLIEEPFPMLSLDKMCATAHQSVQELVELAGVTDNYLKTKERKPTNSAASGTGAFERTPSNGVPYNPSKKI